MTAFWPPECDWDSPPPPFPFPSCSLSRPPPSPRLRQQQKQITQKPWHGTPDCASDPPFWSTPTRRGGGARRGAPAAPVPCSPHQGPPPGRFGCQAAFLERSSLFSHLTQSVMLLLLHCLSVTSTPPQPLPTHIAGMLCPHYLALCSRLKGDGGFSGMCRRVAETVFLIHLVFEKRLPKPTDRLLARCSPVLWVLSRLRSEPAKCVPRTDAVTLSQNIFGRTFGGF